MLTISASPEPVQAYLQDLQARIYQAFRAMDSQAICSREDWTREEGGWGCSQTLHEGTVFEQGGINFSDVHGKELPASATVKRPQLAGNHFRATGLSLVIHPRNPYVPTVHMNLRFFSTRGNGETDEEPVWWFGGGFDLTPYYGFQEDAVHWHRLAQQACQPFGSSRYPMYKSACDRYFYLPHRKEARGIGGLFFDDVNQPHFKHCFAFVRSVGDHFLRAYSPIIERRKDLPYGDRERAFQSYRRGRYVEFNLLYDRGTRFGLQSGGRTESILMSLPPQATWQYDWHPEPGSPEETLYRDFLPPRDWLADRSQK